MYLDGTVIGATNQSVVCFVPVNEANPILYVEVNQFEFNDLTKHEYLMI